MKVKTLIWVPTDSKYGGNVHKAQTPFGPYTVFGDGTVWTPGGGLVEKGTRNGDGDYKNDRLENAKAYAQLDWEERLLECYDE